MAIVFDSDAGTVTGLSVGGLPDGIVDAGTLASDALDSAVTINDTGADVDFRVEGSGEANALFVQGSDGKVGIGTATPDKMLHIEAASGAILRVEETGGSYGELEAGGSGMHLVAKSGGYITLRPNATEAVRILSGGNVGIGNNSPGELLELSKSDSQPVVELSTWSTTDTHKGIVIFQKSASATINTLSATAAGEDLGRIVAKGVNTSSAADDAAAILFEGDAAPDGDAVPGRMSFWTSDAATLQQRMTIDDGGYVGIGTDSPLSPLDVQLHSSGSRRFLVNYDDSLITIKGSNASQNPESLRIVADTLRVYTGTSGSGTKRMTIDNSGNVGIGTTVAPMGTGLAVNSGISSSSTTAIEIQQNTNGANKAAAAFGVAIGNGGEGTNAADLYFSTATNGALVSRMRINSSGNVGIGVTPETWSSTWRTLQIGGNTSIYSVAAQGDGGYGVLGQNVYLNSSGTSTRISGDEASAYSQYHGTHNFLIAPTSTAGSSITWINAMTIANNGYTGFGVVAPTTRIHLNGGTATAANSGIAAAWSVHSDYRMKENIVPLIDATERLKKLNPIRFNWNFEDGTPAVDGFLAHEAQEVVPEAITGTKDAMKTEEYTVSEALGEVFTPAVEEVTEERQVTETVETGSYVNLAGETITETQEVGVTEEATETVIERQDIDGVMTEVEVEKVTQEPVMETVVTTEAVAEVILETDVERPEEPTEGQQWRETTAKVTAEREVPDMQGIDQGKLVPLLVGALQEAIARIETLENP